MPGMRRTDLRDAVTFAGQQWPVTPGTFQIRPEAPWLGKPSSTGIAPIIELNAATTDPAQAWEWWTRHPYSVLLVSGKAVDVFEVPATLGRKAETVLAKAKLRGPIAIQRHMNSVRAAWSYLLTNARCCLSTAPQKLSHATVPDASDSTIPKGSSPRSIQQGAAK